VVDKAGSPCIVCPAHNTAFDLATGEVKGEWCPKFPQLPLVGKVSPTPQQEGCHRGCSRLDGQAQPCS
jgi:nitrite reductase/ring-hydroxylating ferredoxin subunit